MNTFEKLLAALRSTESIFVIIGGVAAALHGSARVTFDLDIVYERSPGNLARIVKALAPFKPYLRGAPPGLPFEFSVETLKHGLNFTFTTTEGSIDLLGELAGIGSYHDVRERTVDAEIYGTTYQFLSLEALIVSKRAAGRPKDLETIAELETIREERK